MLVLTRKKGEAIAIGDLITVKVLKIENSQVKLGVSAPQDIPVHREEIYQRILEVNKQAAGGQVQDLEILPIDLIPKNP